MTSNAQPTPPLNRNWIVARTPHSGTMCLLDTIIAWNGAHIRCNATSHRNTANPLRSHGRLAAVCGIEYAAQAMAVHGALCDAAQVRPRVSFLVSVRSIEAHVSCPDIAETSFDAEAERIDGDGTNVLYRFTVRSGTHILLTGHVAVMLDASVARTCFVRTPAANGRLLLIPALPVALLSPLAHADLSETKENTKQDTKEAACKAGHTVKEAGHAIANTARVVGHGVKNAAHVTKCEVKHVFKKLCEND